MIDVNNSNSQVSRRSFIKKGLSVGGGLVIGAPSLISSEPAMKSNDHEFNLKYKTAKISVSFLIIQD